MTGVSYLPGYMHMHMCMCMHMYDHRCAGLLLTLYALRLLRTHPADTPSAAGTPAAAAAAAAAAAGPRREGWRHLVGLFAYRLLTPLALVPACFAVWVGADPCQKPYVDIGRKQGPPRLGQSGAEQASAAPEDARGGGA